MISIIILLTLGMTNFFLSNFIYSLFGYTNSLIDLISFILFSFSFVPFFFFIVPKILGLPNGKQSLDQYLVSIKLSWLKKSLKVLLWATIGILAIFIPNIIIASIARNYSYIPGDLIVINETFVYFIRMGANYFWQELLFRCLILTMLLRIRKKSYAILINASISLLINLLMQLTLNPYYIYSGQLEFLILSSLSIFIIQSILAFLFIKSKSIIPGFIVQLLLLFIYIPGVFPTTYYGG